MSEYYPTAIDQPVLACELAMFQEEDTPEDELTDTESTRICQQLAASFEKEHKLENHGHLLHDFDPVAMTNLKTNGIVLRNPTFTLSADEQPFVFNVEGPCRVQYLDIVPGETPITGLKSELSIFYSGPHVLCLIDLDSFDTVNAGRYFVTIPYRDLQFPSREELAYLN